MIARIALGAVLPLTLALAAPAFAQEGPEDLEQIEPGAGEWQFEYSGAQSGDGRHGLQLLNGVTERLAIGAEAEFDGPRGGLTFDTVGVVLLYRLRDPDSGKLGIGIEGTASLGRDGTLRQLESRLILERRAPRWWLQGDLILRHSREDGATGTGIAYAVSAQHALGGDLWFGIEGSGQALRIGGDPALAAAGTHYAGPTLTIERSIGGSEVELGLAWLQQLKGDGPGSGPRAFIQLTF